MAHWPEMYALRMMLEETHPHHGYSFEPQSHQYLLHGDLWDCAYDRTPAGHVFLPMTLELGSWLWIRKNPRQLFSRHGIFNPMKEHRTRRVLSEGHAQVAGRQPRHPNPRPDRQRRAAMQPRHLRRARSQPSR